MIPIIPAVSLGSVAASHLIPKGLAPTQTPPNTLFANHLNGAIQQQGTTSASDLTKIQSLLALQRTQKTLSPDQQLALSQMLFNKTVQVRDSSGNSVVGAVSGLQPTAQGMTLTINGKNYPISSIQAVLNGVSIK